MTIFSKLIPLVSFASLLLVDAGRAQESQPTIYRFKGTTAAIYGNTRSSCVSSSLGINAFSSVRRDGPVEYTQRERMVSIRYNVTDVCAKMRLEMSADLPATDAYLPSTLDSAHVSVTGSARIRKCTYSGPIVCESVWVPLTLQASVTGDPELYSTSRTRSLARIGTQLITRQYRNRVVAGTAEFSLQIGDHTASAENLEAYLDFERDGSITIEELPRDPASP
jgi:hypothetical protein